jgi:hypothetical protein
MEKGMTCDKLATAIYTHFNISVSSKMVNEEFGKRGVTYKKICVVDKRFFGRENLQYANQFLLYRLAIEADDCVWVDEFAYQEGQVGLVCLPLRSALC